MGKRGCETSLAYLPFAVVIVLTTFIWRSQQFIEAMSVQRYYCNTTGLLIYVDLLIKDTIKGSAKLGKDNSVTWH